MYIGKCMQYLIIIIMVFKVMQNTELLFAELFLFSVLIGWKVKRRPISDNLFLIHVYFYGKVYTCTDSKYSNNHLEMLFLLDWSPFQAIYILDSGEELHPVGKRFQCFKLDRVLMLEICLTRSIAIFPKLGVW